MTDSEIVPGLGHLHRNDFYAEAVRLMPDADKQVHIAIALALSRARMKGEADGYTRAAADLISMASRMQGSADVLLGKKRGAA